MGYLTKLCNPAQRNPFVPKRLMWPKCDGVRIGFDVNAMKFISYKQLVVAAQSLGVYLIWKE